MLRNEADLQGGGSKPAVAAKSPIERGADRSDHADDQEIPIAPFELRHELEVHAVDAGDRGRHREDGGPSRELSGDRRLLRLAPHQARFEGERQDFEASLIDRKSTRLNSS